MTAIITYLKHVREEFTHIVWPTWEVALAHTLVVLLIAALLAVWIGVIDYLFGEGVTRIIGV